MMRAAMTRSSDNWVKHLKVAQESRGLVFPEKTLISSSSATATLPTGLL